MVSNEGVWLTNAGAFRRALMGAAIFDLSVLGFLVVTGLLVGEPLALLRSPAILAVLAIALPAGTIFFLVQAPTGIRITPQHIAVRWFAYTRTFPRSQLTGGRFDVRTRNMAKPPGDRRYWVQIDLSGTAFTPYVLGLLDARLASEILRSLPVGTAKLRITERSRVFEERSVNRLP